MAGVELVREFGPMGDDYVCNAGEEFARVVFGLAGLCRPPLVPSLDGFDSVAQGCGFAGFRRDGYIAVDVERDGDLLGCAPAAIQSPTMFGSGSDCPQPRTRARNNTRTARKCARCLLRYIRLWKPLAAERCPARVLRISDNDLPVLLAL